jgi:eukaryotic-like serine/threonine-protein kinase
MSKINNFDRRQIAARYSKIMNNTIDNRYQIINLLGEGGSGKTFQAIDTLTQQPVAIKILSLRRAQDWKTIELFEREAKILAQLNHPQIPKYLDFFRAKIDREDTFCIVQEIAPGRSLWEWMNNGYQFTQIEVRAIAIQVLEVTNYLQSFSPPIIHRDLKPQNILMTEAGTISLVDFGAVRDTYHLTITGGSTIVGTYGYMAPEQFVGRAVLATDLYGLGATLVYLLTGTDPGELPQTQMKIDFRDRVQVTEDFGRWLERLLEPIPEDRFTNAEIALRALNGKLSLADRTLKPKYIISQLSINEHGLKIYIPAIWFSTRSSKKALIQITITIAIGVFLLWLITVATVSMSIVMSIMILIISAGFWLGLWLFVYIHGISTHQEISIEDRQTICREYSFSNWSRCKKVTFEHHQGVACLNTFFCRHEEYLEIRTKSDLYLSSKTDRYLFGRFLDPVEKRWLCGEIDRYIQEHAHPGDR